MYPIIDDFFILLSDNNFIPIKKFEERFGDAEEHRFEYDYFINHEKVTAGWKSIFDEWKERGILN